MKTYFKKQLDLIKEMAAANITERMQRCDILIFETRLTVNSRLGGITCLRKDNNGIVLFDCDVFISRLSALTVDELSIVSDALEL